MPEITITGKDGSFSGYLATPAAGSGPGIAGNSLATIHSYPGLDHAFCRVGGQNYARTTTGREPISPTAAPQTSYRPIWPEDPPGRQR